MGIFVGKTQGGNILHLTTGGRTASDQDPRADSIFHSKLPYLKCSRYVSTQFSSSGEIRYFSLPLEQVYQNQQGKVVLLFFQDAQGLLYQSTPYIGYYIDYQWQMSFSNNFGQGFYGILNPGYANSQAFGSFPMNTPSVSPGTQLLYQGENTIQCSLGSFIVQLHQVVLDSVQWSGQGTLSNVGSGISGQEQILVNNQQLSIGSVDLLNMGIIQRYDQYPLSNSQGISIPQTCTIPLPGAAQSYDMGQNNIPFKPYISSEKIVQYNGSLTGVTRTYQRSYWSSCGINGDPYHGATVVKKDINMYVPVFGVHGRPSGQGVELDGSIPRIRLGGHDVFQPNIGILYTVSPQSTQISVPQVTVNVGLVSAQDIPLTEVNLGLTGRQSGLYSISSMGALSLKSHPYQNNPNLVCYLNVPAQKGRHQQLVQLDPGYKIPLITQSQSGLQYALNTSVVSAYQYTIYMVRNGTNVQIRAYITQQGQFVGGGSQVAAAVQLPQFNLSVLPLIG